MPVLRLLSTHLFDVFTPPKRRKVYTELNEEEHMEAVDAPKKKEAGDCSSAVGPQNIAARNKSAAD